jgi:hypothetical protein
MSQSSIMKKASASDYIAIKRQTAIFTGKNKNNMVIQADAKCCSATPPTTVCKVRTSKNYEILNDFYNGQKYIKEYCPP